MRSTLPRRMLAAVSAVVTVVALAACAGSPGAANPIRLGWGGDIPPLDPAASDSVESFAFLTQIYPSLLRVESEEHDPALEIAESAEWTADGVYTVVLKPGLEFANGDELTTSDVKFSLERQLALQSEDGAWRELDNLDHIEVVDETTISFHLGTKADTSFPFVLAGPAGLVLDEEAFFADELTPDEDILDAEPFAGPFTLAASRTGTLTLTPYRGFGGVQPAAAAIELRPGDGEDLSRQLLDGSIDVLTGRLPVAAVQTLADDGTVEFARASSGRVRLLAFDFAHMPFGSRTETADAAKAAAVRTAIADVVDRDAFVAAGGRNHVMPLTGYLPDGVPGARDVFSAARGDGDGGPDSERAEATLVGAGIAEPVDLTIHVDFAALGAPANAELDELRTQLEDSGLFTVMVVETDADAFATALAAGDVQAVFTSVQPTTADPGDYLAPLRAGGVLAPGYGDAAVDRLLARRITELDPDVRAATLFEAQTSIAGKVPAIPVTQGVRVVFARASIAPIDLGDALPLDLSMLRRQAG